MEGQQFFFLPSHLLYPEVTKDNVASKKDLGSQLMGLCFRCLIESQYPLPLLPNCATAMLSVTLAEPKP